MNHNTYNPSPESFPPNRVVLEGLTSAYEVHEMLGADGVNAVETNQFGDTALAADVQSEKAVIDSLVASGITATLHSEEHGIVQINEGGASPILAVLDGLDGSSVYKKERGTGLYGTMFAMFENENPTYNEYTSVGLTLPSVHKMLIANRGEGVQVVDLLTGDVTDAHTTLSPLTKESLIYADGDIVPKHSALYDYFENNYDTFVEPLERAGYSTHRTGSSAAYYAQLALGQAVAVGESTRKGNLEYATAYALVKEAGGQFVSTETWQDIGEQLFLTYGQSEHIAHLAVANSAVLDRLKPIIKNRQGLLSPQSRQALNEFNQRPDRALR